MPSGQRPTVRRPAAINRLVLLLFYLFALTFLTPSPSLAAEPITKVKIQPEMADSYKNLVKVFEGDLPDLAKRGVIRVLVANSRTNFFLDGATQRGITHEVLVAFEEFLNKKLGKSKKAKRIRVFPIIVSLDQFIPMLEAKRGDIAAAGLTITPERTAKVDFSTPFYSKTMELVVAGKDAPPLSSLDDLSGKSVYIRLSSSYRESLEELNKSLAAKGLKTIEISPADENLPTEKILEMVSAGLVDYTVADDYLANFWAGVLPGLVVYKDLAVAKDKSLAWAIRKGCPQLTKMVNEFVPTVKKGTLMGNVIFKKYLQNTKWVKNPAGGDGVAQFKQAREFFKKYGEKYGFDWLMVAAQGYQESGLNQNLVSPRGAVGVMQLLPSTAAADPIKIPDIKKMERNIEAGVKYLNHIREQYFNDPAILPEDQVLLSFAGYNAGPNRVGSLRKETARMGLDPNKWFNNVEMATAKVVGRETVQYVSNIYVYYLTYRLMVEREKKINAVVDSHKNETVPAGSAK